jgi:hypothetical protein
LYTDGSFTNIDVPGATGSTYAWGINNSGQIVGYYYDMSTNKNILVAIKDKQVLNNILLLGDDSVRKANEWFFTTWDDLLPVAISGL